MQRRTFLTASAATAALVGVAPVTKAAPTGSATAPPAFPLLQPWSGSHNGGPAFDKARVDDFEPAFEAAIEANRREIAAIAGDPAAPTFANTIAALENAGRPFGRVVTVFGVYTSTLNDKPMQAVEAKMAPRLAAFADEVVQNAALFARIKAVNDGLGAAGLTPEQKRLTQVVHRDFARQGAALDSAGKTRLAAINQRLASLYTLFSQNELADEEGFSLTLTDKAQLAGLPDSLMEGAALAAKDKGLAGKWLITNTRSSMEPFLTYSSRRDLREKGWRMWVMRGDNGGAHDNNAIIAEILKLRAEKANLLGFPTYAHWQTEDQMAKTPEAAMELMMKVWTPAKARVAEEVSDMAPFAQAEAPGSVVEPWDYRYYSEKVRKAKYDLDESEVKPYLQMEKLREGMFWAAGRLYGFEFVPVSDLPVYQGDVRTFVVMRDGRQVGLWYFDPYARAGKNSGAWMSEYRPQERFAGEITPVVSNNANFVKVAAGAPILVSWDDAVTMFHEFGHALHGLNSNVEYPTLAGTNVARDFVEFPSQLNERWLPTREVLTRFAVHYQTGEPMPDALVKKIKTAHTFNKGFDTVEYLASAIVDMKAHLAGATPIDPRTFETATLAELGMPKAVVMRHRMPQFGHIFSGEGYAAGYYDYIWADALTADAAEAFAEAPGGFYDKPTAKRLHDDIMSVGNTIPADEAFRRFRGRDVTIDALMRDRGFPVTA
ncbi:MAG: M3 family metallopeptidase [Caulobacteraceae bacterium]